MFTVDIWADNLHFLLFLGFKDGYHYSSIWDVWRQNFWIQGICTLITPNNEEIGHIDWMCMKLLRDEKEMRNIWNCVNHSESYYVWISFHLSITFSPVGYGVSLLSPTSIYADVWVLIIFTRLERVSSPQD